MSVISDLESGLSNSWNSISSTGAPAVIAGIENYAADALKGDAQSNQAASQAAVTAAVKAGGNATGIMKSIQDSLGAVAQGAVFKQYGLYIVGGLALLLIVGRRIL